MRTAQIRDHFPVTPSPRTRTGRGRFDFPTLRMLNRFRTIRLTILGASRNNDLLWASA